MMTASEETGFAFGSWNYRLVEQPDGIHGAYLVLHEVYYNPDGTIRNWCPARPLGMGDTHDDRVADFLGALELMKLAATSPVITLAEMAALEAAVEKDIAF